MINLEYGAVTYLLIKCYKQVAPPGHRKEVVNTGLCYQIPTCVDDLCHISYQTAKSCAKWG